jgi:hypothetical protein
MKTKSEEIWSDLHMNTCCSASAARRTPPVSAPHPLPSAPPPPPSASPESPPQPSAPHRPHPRPPAPLLRLKFEPLPSADRRVNIDFACPRWRRLRSANRAKLSFRDRGRSTNHTRSRFRGMKFVSQCACSCARMATKLANGLASFVGCICRLAMDVTVPNHGGCPRYVTARKQIKFKPCRVETNHQMV